MQGTKKGEMEYLLLSESFGGNAGSFNEFSCAGANFHYDQKSGEIQYFGNIQSVPQEIKQHYVRGIFRVAADIKKMFSESIEERKKLSFENNINIVNKHFDQKISKRAEQNLEETVRIYNETYGFQI